MMYDHMIALPIPVAERSKARVCGTSLAGIAGSNPAGGMDVCLLCVVCCRVEISATGRSLVQRSLADLWCVTMCYLETSQIRRPWPALGCCAEDEEEEEDISLTCFDLYRPYSGRHLKKSK